MSSGPKPGFRVVGRYPIEPGTGGRTMLPCVQLDDEAALDPEHQQALDSQIRILEIGATQLDRAGHETDELLTDRHFPGASTWMVLRRRSIALLPVYRAAETGTFGQGIDVERALTTPLWQGRSAQQLLADDLGEATTAQVLQVHRDFLNAEFSPEWSAMLRGCLDGRAIRSQAAAACMLAESAMIETTHDLRVVSLACGPGGAVSRIAGRLAARGKQIGDLVLFDRDPIALGVAREVISEMLDEFDEIQQVRYERGNLLTDGFEPGDLSAVAEPGTVDVVEVLGLIEYLPDDAAVTVLAMAARLARPGGVVIFGNMLLDRPQQVFFEQVMRWPELYQRTPEQVFDLCGRAGLDPARASALVPSESVHLVLGCRVPG